ncbi:MAG TPA: hypothetical protein OIM49_01000 [Clostridiaceae bacterium]|jgi:hypothetical protein|nr:hypothetical protein [Clostridiaceae bacterium]
MMHEQNLSSKIEEIYSILDEIQLNQVEMLLSIQKNQSIIIKKIEKLQEYNEIDDMNNSLFDQKLTRIEEYCKG